jgi:hypothetical protein
MLMKMAFRTFVAINNWLASLVVKVCINILQTCENEIIREKSINKIDIRVNFRYNNTL